jgi:hypothetical protein
MCICAAAVSYCVMQVLTALRAAVCTLYYLRSLQVYAYAAWTM